MKYTRFISISIWSPSFPMPFTSSLPMKLFENTAGTAEPPMDADKPLRPQVPNHLTRREMDSLTAICDTLLPSIHVTNADHDEHVRSFYRTSASMLGSHEATGDYLLKTRHALLGLLRLGLWLLSTWFGAFLLCGAMNMSGRFPFVHKFSDLDPERREKIVFWWANNPLYLYRELFRGMKFLAAFCYFTKVDEKNENPTWKALGYCGPDPEHIKQKLESAADEHGDQGGADDRLGPLHRAVADIQNPKNSLFSHLSKAGLSLTTRPPRRNDKIVTLTGKPLLTIQCDAVIVGSGSGGGVVAGVLAKAGYNVVVLEKGDYCAGSNLTLLEGQTLESMYEGGGLLATDDTGVIILAGSTVGGGSAINWSAALRTPDHVVSEWRNEYGLELFGSDAYEDALSTVCDRMGVQCEEVRDENLSNSALRRGCSKLGYPVKDIPRNSTADHHCGWCCFGCGDGRKKGTCETWLVDMAESGNGIILPGCRAIKVLHDDKKRMRKKAAGVVFEYDNGWSGKKETGIIESKVTVVACGALNTPVLLKKSGLRNAQIGKNLHLHPVVVAWGYFPPTEGSKINSYEGGIMTAMSHVFPDSNEKQYSAIIQTPSLHPGMFSVMTPWTSGADYKERMSRFAHTAHIFTLARDKGSGIVDSCRSISYRMDGSDQENLKRGMGKMLRILAAAGAEEIGTQHCKGDRLAVNTASTEQFEKFVEDASRRGLRDLSTPICSAHQMGSCRMGVNPETSVVNQNGETWEVEGLFVADSSVFPTALGVNPMVTVQAIAFCTARSVLEVLQRKIKKKSSSRQSSK